MPKVPFIFPSDSPIEALKVSTAPENENENVGVAVQSSRFANLNMGLLWHRYLPARDADKERLYQPTPFGIDFTDDLAAEAKLESAHKADQGNPNKRKTYRAKSNAIKDTPAIWNSYGIQRWFTEECGRAGSKELFKQLHKRRDAVLFGGVRADDRRRFNLRSLKRTMPGMGNSSVFDGSSLAFHHTYGFPLIPAASLKGLARHYLEEELFHDDEWLYSTKQALPDMRSYKALSSMLFGREPKGGSDQGTEGQVVFHDAWPVPGETKWLTLDVMAVHHRDYYAGPQKKFADDKESPTVVHFICFAPGVEFTGGIALASPYSGDSKQGIALLDIVQDVLAGALELWGIGAKTGADYGRMRLSRQALE